MNLVFTRHYEVNPIGEDNSSYCKIDRIKYFFNEGTFMEYNWLFLSTSGVHGTYATLDKIAKNWEYRNCECEDENGHEHYGNYVTICYLQPRTCVLYYGNVELESLEDIEYLREYVTKTLEAVKASQVGNTE